MAIASGRYPSRTLDIAGLEFKTQRAWTAWLKKNHASSDGVWLRIRKKSSSTISVTYAEALDAALCYGWIDAQKKAGDAETFLQRFTPRGPRSIWSKINREKVLALIEAGRMQAPGQAAIDRAKENGNWDAAYDSFKTKTIPLDLQAALDANPRAKAFYATLQAHNRYAILWRVQTAKRPETRARRIETFVTMLENGETLH